MHRFTNTRVPLWLAASALLVVGGVVVANPAAQAQPKINAMKICKNDVTPATALDVLNDPDNGLFGYTAIIGRDSTDPKERDVLKGTSKNEVIWGFAGNDQLKGGGGNDILCGGPGKDQLKGGSGTNHLVGGGGKDTIKGGGGTDYIYSDDADAPPAKPGGGVNFQCPTATMPDQCKG